MPGRPRDDEDGAGQGDDESGDGGQPLPASDALGADRAAAQGDKRGDAGGPVRGAQHGRERDQRAEHDGARQGDGGDGEVGVQVLDDSRADEEGGSRGPCDDADDGPGRSGDDGGAQHGEHDLPAARADAAHEADGAVLTCHEGGEGGGDDDARDHRAHGRQQVEDHGDHRAARLGGGGAFGDGVVGVHHEGAGSDGVDGLGDLVHQGAGTGPWLRRHVQVVVAGDRAHGLELVDRGVDGAPRPLVQARVGPGGDHAHDGRAGMDYVIHAVGVVGVVGAVGAAGAAVVAVLEADGVPDAEPLLLGEAGVDGDLAGADRQTPGRQGGVLAEHGHVPNHDRAAHGARELARQVELEDAPVLAAHGGDAVEVGESGDEGIVEVAVGAAELASRGDDDIGAADGQAGLGLHLGAEGVGEDEGEGDEGGAHGHGHEGRSGAARVEQGGHQRASLRVAAVLAVVPVPVGAVGPAGVAGPAGPAGAAVPAVPVGAAGVAGSVGVAGPAGVTQPAGAAVPAVPAGVAAPAGLA